MRRKRIFFVAIFLLIVVLLSLVGCFGSASPSANQTYKTVQLEDFVDEIRNNPTKAKDKYLNQYIQLIGVQDRIMGENMFFLKSPIYNLNTLMLCFEPGNKNVLQRLKESNNGSICLVKGKVTQVGAVSKITVYDMQVNLSASRDGLTYKRYMDNELFGDLQKNIYVAKEKYFGKNIMFVGFAENINSKFYITSIFNQYCRIECIVNNERILRAVRQAAPGNAYTIKGTIVQVGPRDFPMRYTMEIHDIYEYRGEEK